MRVAGTVATGRFGPDLTHLMSRDTIGSGIVPNTVENLRAWIRNPDSLKQVALLAALAAVALVYSRGWLGLRRLAPELMSAWWPGAFFTGLAALWVALGSPLAAFDEELLSVHMAQHILLSAVAAPLILVGAPALPLLHGVPRRFAVHGLAPLIRWRPVCKLVL
jgi:cytochrome c oxidase assembly factor CtaG